MDDQTSLDQQVEITVRYAVQVVPILTGLNKEKTELEAAGTDQSFRMELLGSPVF